MSPGTPIQDEINPVVISPSMLNQQQPPRPRIQHPTQMPQRINRHGRGTDPHGLYNGIIPLLRLVCKLQRGLLPKSDLGLCGELRMQLLPFLPRDLEHWAGLIEEGYALACSEIVIFCIPPCADGGFEDVARSLIYEAFAEGVDAAEGLGGVDLVVKGLREVVVAIGGVWIWGGAIGSVYCRWMAGLCAQLVEPVAVDGDVVEADAGDEVERSATR